MREGRKMFKVGICGHFGLKKELFNGQTIKTKMLTSALEAELGKKDIVKIDTHGGMKVLPKVFLQLLVSFIECQTVIMLPAHNGVKIFAPFLAIFGKLLHCQILYVVIGGWHYFHMNKMLFDEMKKLGLLSFKDYYLHTFCALCSTGFNAKLDERYVL